MKIAILLSVFKPNVDFLNLQIRSILETSEQVTILMRFDDGQVIEEMSKNERIICDESVENLGIEGSFRRLMRIAYMENFQIFLFSDQDDIWCKNKISIMLNNVPKGDVPWLITSKYSLIDENGYLINGVKTDELSTKFPTAIFRNTDNGNCMAFNRALAKIYLETKISSKKILHDSWMHLIAQILADYRCVNQTLVKYRQHSLNVVGVKNMGFAKRVLRSLQTPYYYLQYLELRDNLTIINAKDEVLKISKSRLNMTCKVLKYVRLRYILSFWFGACMYYVSSHGKHK